MAPTLQGPGLLSICSKCGGRQELAFDTFNPQLPIRCYLCGGEGQILAEAKCPSCDHSAKLIFDGGNLTLAEDGLLAVKKCDSCQEKLHIRPISGQLVETDPVQARGVRRLDPIVLSYHGKALVKRVWGLGGERLAIREGDLFVDGQRLRKSLAQARSLAIPINRLGDGSHRWRTVSKQPSDIDVSKVEDVRPDPTLPAVDEAATQASDPHGKSPEGAIRQDLQVPYVLPATHVLRWSYLKPAGHGPDQDSETRWLKPSPLDDDLPLNQGLSFLPQTAPDYMLSIVFRKELRSTVFVRSLYKNRSFEFQLVPSRDHPKDEQSNASFALPVKNKIVLAFIDHQVLAESEIAGLRINWEDLPPPTTEIHHREATIEIDGVDSDIRLETVCIERDLHLRDADPWRKAGSQSAVWTVPKDCFFVLGDNPLASMDSRNGLGMIPSQTILGVLVSESP